VPTEPGLDEQECLLDWVVIRRVRRQVKELATCYMLEPAFDRNSTRPSLILNECTNLLCMVNVAVVEDENTARSGIWVHEWNLQVRVSNAECVEQEW
jgi:hypothetical protein